jgi:GNAT superfamily N-acetyltransferase
MFDHAYGALAAEFGPRGELERREVLERWLDAGSTYHLLIARDAAGSLAGVRDCHVILDAGARVVIAYLAHALVLPPYRRSGLGGLLRAAPIALARKVLHQAGLGAGDVDVVLAAEMEHPVAGDSASIVRLIAYGKEGFAAIDPAQLPYLQPDFRDLATLPAGSSPAPLPLLAVVRWLGHEGEELLPTRLARAYVKHLYTVFGTHVARGHLTPLEARMLDVLERSAGDRGVSLLPLPRALADEVTRLALSSRA